MPNINPEKLALFLLNYAGFEYEAALNSAETNSGRDYQLAQKITQTILEDKTISLEYKDKIKKDLERIISGS